MEQFVEKTSKPSLPSLNSRTQTARVESAGWLLGPTSFRVYLI